VSTLVIRTLNPGVTWGGWRVATVVELAIVVLLGLVMLGVGVVQFARSD
jgi:ABC-2 type transport system permease protein